MTPLAREASTTRPSARRTAEMRTAHDGPVTIAQDLTVFNVTAEAIVTRQTLPDPFPWPVLGPTGVTGPPLAPISGPPAWWSDALFTG